MQLLQQTLFWIGTFVAFYGLVMVGINYLPPGESLPNEFVGGVQMAFAYMRGLDFLLPMTTVFSIVVLSMGYELIVWTFQFVLWAIHLYRGLRT